MPESKQRQGDTTVLLRVLYLATSRRMCKTFSIARFEFQVILIGPHQYCESGTSASCVAQM